MVRCSIFFFVLILYCCNSFAQHCPFDGTSIIMVKLFSADRVLQKSNEYDFVLQEIDNPHPDSCEYAKGLLQLTFNPINELYSQNKKIPEYEKRLNVSLTKKGNFYVLLGMAETECMQPSGIDYAYYNRKFEIVITNKKTAKKKSIIIPMNKIYSLCTNGDWNRIKALEIKI